MKHYARSRRSKAPPDWPDDLPPPRVDEPPDPKPGDEIGHIELNWYGTLHKIPLRVPGDSGARRARSDQVAALIDGQWFRLSLRAAALELAASAPRVLPRRYRQ